MSLDLNIFGYLAKFEYYLWSYVGFFFICISGLYLTIYSKGFQLEALRNFTYNFKKAISSTKDIKVEGVNPFKLYLTAVGGMVGIGNIINVAVAVCIGGLGSLFWMWIAVFFGTVIKYSEIYLGIKYRTLNSKNHYDGGPMFYLPIAFKGIVGKFLAYLVAFLLCVYSIEIFQFTVLVESLHSYLAINKTFIIIPLLIAVLYVGIGGVYRLAKVSSILTPIFVISYTVACLYIVILNIHSLPAVILEIFKSAFLDSAPLGGFVGSSMMLAGYHGAVTAVYSGDIGIGYDAVIQSETYASKAKTQAQIAIYALLTDNFLCTMTALVVGVTGAWRQSITSQVMVNILSEYLPCSDLLIMILLVFAGYTTITAFFTAGLKSSRFLSQKYGNVLFYLFSILLFAAFSYSTSNKARIIMQISGGLLMIINITAILKLRNQVDFSKDE